MQAGRLRVTLDDATSPLFVGTPSGSLTTQTSSSSIRTLNYSATDGGSGVFTQQLIIDGVGRTPEVVDANGGKCATLPNVADHFASPSPCKTNVAGRVTLDTRALADGNHEVELRIVDATSENAASQGPYAILVDNVPPTVGTVTVSGTAREGETLTCAAPVVGQTPQTAYAWSRSAADGSGQTLIAGAISSSYVMTAADVGKKVLCSVSATDGGGTTTKQSTITDGPFASGAVVEARLAEPPPPTTNPNPSPTGGTSTSADTTTNTTSSSTDKATTSAVVVTAAQAAAVLPPACTRSVVEMPTVQTSLRRTYRRSGVTLTGRLVDLRGVVLGGADLNVMQVVRRAASIQRTKVASTRTSPDGTFRVSVPRGPSRQLQLEATGCGSVGPLVTERVRGVVQARTTTRRVRNRQTARFVGRVLGGHVGRGVPLELQAKVGREWRDIKAVTTDSRGRYKVSYRFLRTFVRYTYRFRIVSRAGAGWPFLPAKSRVVKVTVN